MNISTKAIWKVVTNHEHLFDFPKIVDTEWILAKSQFSEDSEKFDRFLRSQPVAPDEQIYIVEGPHEVTESTWGEFLNKYDIVLAHDKNIWITNLSFNWLFVYNHIGVAKFGKKMNVGLPQNLA